ncbi:ABC transporter substrate-binding protein [Labrenzia sp. CE80]|uniref:ABC transporter substrate-binding protein n=1 Tax=Labrenzia sp. CE80 TaxID=1788986 RepID=UPI001930F317|nr:ABC transporter substrate-binding protein [Labrenzia sp. CE80]
MAGRTVELAGPPERIILLEARDMVSMAMLHSDPAALVVGWAATDRIDSSVLRASLQGDRSIAIVGKQTPDTISLEGLLDLAPDLVVANYFMLPRGAEEPLVKRLATFGIPVIFSDTSNNVDEEARRDPLESLPKLVRMWAGVLDAREKAREFLAFVDMHLRQVTACIEDARPTTTYLEVQSTLQDCCWAAGNSIWGKLLQRAGGKGLPGVTEAWYQKLQLEYLISTPQDVYIASGGGWGGGSRPAIGPGLSTSEGRKALDRLTRRTGFQNLPSVRSGRVHGIWTGLITVPELNILFVEVVAKWLHPERCAAIDPAGTLAEMNRRFLSVPIQPDLWVSLKDH